VAEQASTGTQGRRGGHRKRQVLRTEAPFVALPTLVRNIPVYEVLNEEGVELIHERSMRILEEVGIDFRDDEALALWREAGADVSGQRVRIARELIMSLVGRAPSEYTLHGRNPDRTVRIGGRNMVFAPTYGSPFILGLDGVRRYSTLEDLQMLLKLTHQQPALHLSGGVLCEPVDVPVSKRHLRIAYSCLKFSDKPFMGAVTARERAEDTVAMAKIVFGEDFVAANTVMTSVCNCNSPLVWDRTMLDAVKVYARNNQAVLLSPFVMAGANTPASTVGAVALLNAEALAGIAFAQLVQPGAPMVYGNYLATVSMRSGAPMAGTPEISLMNFMIGQLARRYGVPWRSSGMTTGSKVVDVQAAYEANATMSAVVLAGANFVFHTAGWLEAGLTVSVAKLMLDGEQAEMFYRLAQGPQFDDLDEALAAVEEIGPGGHFLGTRHTQDHFQSAFFMSELFDNNSYEQWLAEGATDAAERALAKARVQLDRYDEIAPTLDPAVDEQLLAFVAAREAELPDTVS
jgi:trimethylamine---corrinoid protein Co-methyltransferase